jgi:hypothetical protein
MVRSRDSSVSMVTRLGLGERVSIPGTGVDFLLHRVQTGSGAHPTSYSMSNRVSSFGVKRPGREADHSPPSGASVKERLELDLHFPIRSHGVLTY